MVKSETRRDAEILVRNPSPRLFGKKLKFRDSKQVKNRPCQNFPRPTFFEVPFATPVSGGMNIPLFFTWVASKLELGSNAHACINFHTNLAARHEEPLVCPRERDKVRILSRENCLQIRDCAIITWRGGWEMGEICPKSKSCPRCH